MRYSNVSQLIDRSITFPIEHARLIDQIGGVKLTAPTGDSVPVSSILEQTDESTYYSSEMLFTTIIGNLDERFIGNKYYDDRAGNSTCMDPRRSFERSF